MRFCSLKTYLSTFCQLISSHPTVFNCESVLGLFTDTYTFSFDTFASHVSLSWALPYLFSSFTCWFRLGVGFLTHPFQPHHTVRYLPVNLGMWLGYFVPTQSLLNYMFSWFEFFRVHLSTCMNWICVTKQLKFDNPKFCLLFQTQGVVFYTTSLCPLLDSLDG